MILFNGLNMNRNDINQFETILNMRNCVKYLIYIINIIILLKLAEIFVFYLLYKTSQVSHEIHVAKEVNHVLKPNDYIVAIFDGDYDINNIVRFDMNGNMLYVMHQRQNNLIGFQWIPPIIQIYFPG